MIKRHGHRYGNIAGYSCDNINCVSPTFLHLTKDNIALINGKIFHSCSKKCKHDMLKLANKILK